MHPLKKACCCVNLKTGALIVGWLGCAQSAFHVLQIVLGLAFGLNEYASNGFTVFILVVVTIQFGIHFLVIKAAGVGSRKYLLPWLWLNVPLCVIYSLGMCFIFFTAQTLVALPVLLVLAAWWLYVWLCIYSYYEKLGIYDVLI